MRKDVQDSADSLNPNLQPIGRQTCPESDPGQVGPPNVQVFADSLGPNFLRNAQDSASSSDPNFQPSVHEWLIRRNPTCDQSIDRPAQNRILAKSICQMSKIWSIRWIPTFTKCPRLVQFVGPQLSTTCLRFGRFVQPQLATNRLTKLPRIGFWAGRCAKCPRFGRLIGSQLFTKYPTFSQFVGSQLSTKCRGFGRFVVAQLLTNRLIDLRRIGFWTSRPTKCPSFGRFVGPQLFTKCPNLGRFVGSRVATRCSRFGRFVGSQLAPNRSTHLNKIGFWANRSATCSG